MNISSAHEGAMLRILGLVAGAADRCGIPVLAIAYPRREGALGDDNYDALRSESEEQYATLVAHCCRIAVDLGADVVKTKYTGTVESFARVVRAAQPVPVVIAGGSLSDPLSALDVARCAVMAGGAGVSFGRNVFGQASPRDMVLALREVVHRGTDPAAA